MVDRGLLESAGPVRNLLNVVCWLEQEEQICPTEVVLL